MFLGGDDTVAPSIELRIFRLQFRMLLQVGDATADTLVETDGGLETWYGMLQFRAVEDDGDSLVAQEITREVPLLG